MPRGFRHPGRLDDNLDATVSGLLPMPPRSLPPGTRDTYSPVPHSPSPARTDPWDFASSRGELPAASPDDGADEPTVRRTKVTFSSPRRPARAEPKDPDVPHDPDNSEISDDEARVYVAPPDGLSKFDLGSVPASVTPPPTWRRAAWFAALSSGGVAVALLVAGSILASHPPAERQAIEGWPDRPGGAPMSPGEDYREEQSPVRPDGSSPSPGPPTRQTPADIEAVEKQAGLRSEPRPDSSADSESVDWTGTVQPSTAPPSHEPEKPPVAPAPTTKAKQQYLWSAYDADTMGQRSQEYFNTVTEDPDAAYAMTTGELAAEGSEGLRRRYADVAYFQVLRVYIDENEGYTLNTVETTFKDGTSTQQVRRLAFDTREKISAEGG